MKLANIVFWVAGGWGVLVLTPLCSIQLDAKIHQQ
jgi:hypothetical protein